MQAAQHQCGFSWRTASCESEPKLTAQRLIPELSGAEHCALAKAADGAAMSAAPHAIAARRETVVKLINYWASDHRNPPQDCAYISTSAAFSKACNFESNLNESSQPCVARKAGTRGISQ